MMSVPPGNPGGHHRVYPFIIHTMNAKQKKFAAIAAVIAVTVPAVGYAAANTSTGSAVMNGAFKGFRAGSGAHMGEGRFMKFGNGEAMGKAGMMGGAILSNENVRATLAASGVTLPTAAEATAFHDKMKAARDAENALSDADKAGLKTIRDAAQEKMRTLREETAKAERDYLRSKGVALPSEEEIAKMRDTMEKAAEVLKANRPNFDKSKFS